MPTVKQILKSKTLWTAAGTVVAGGFQAAIPLIPPQYAPLVIAAGSAIAHTVVRFFTNKPLSEK